MTLFFRLEDQSIVAGLYSNPTITVNQKGIIVAIEEGASESGGGGGDPTNEWITGSDDPDSGEGNDTDLYFHTTTNDVWKKVSGTWEVIGNIQGGQGIQGIQGIQGFTGLQGDPGAPGVGVPTGGTTGQKLVKASDDDYDTEWVNDVGSSDSDNFELVNDLSPQLGGMLDVNGFGFGDGTLELLVFSEVVSAVNHIQIQNAATGGKPCIQAVGDDTNIDLELKGKGSGMVRFPGSGAYIAVGNNGWRFKDNGTGSCTIGTAAIGSAQLVISSSSSNTFTGGISFGNNIFTPHITIVAPAARQMRFGGASASPGAYIVEGMAGSGTNIVGGELTVRPGVSTGDASPSTMRFQRTAAGSSGTTAQTFQDSFIINASGVTFYDIVTYLASTSSLASFRIPVGVDVTTPTEGDVWHLSTGVWIYHNSTKERFVFASELESSDSGSDNFITDGDVLVVGLTFPSGLLMLQDSDESHTLALAVGTDLSDDRTLSVDMQDADRVLKFVGDGVVGEERSFGIQVDNGGEDLESGLIENTWWRAPYDCTIIGWVVTGDDVGDIVFDVWKDVFANFPPTVADTIAGSEKPTLSSARTNSDLSLTTWTTTVSKGDVFFFNIDSVSDIKYAVLEIVVRLR